MKIKFKGKRVGIEKIKKQEKKNSSFLVIPESEEYIGVVRYVGEDVNPDQYKNGMRVYFTTQHQQMRIGGLDICVMDYEEIVAVISEEELEKQA